MLDSAIPHTIASLETILALLGATTFLVLYVSIFNWRKTHPGSAVFYFVLSLVVVSTLPLLTILFGRDYFGREWVRVLAWLFVVFTSWRLTWVLFRSWRRGKKRPLNIETKPTKTHKPDSPADAEYRGES